MKIPWPLRFTSGTCGRPCCFSQISCHDCCAWLDTRKCPTTIPSADGRCWCSLAAAGTSDDWGHWVKESEGEYAGPCSWSGSLCVTWILDIHWLVTGTCFVFQILGMSSSQLTFEFFRGVETTNQYICRTLVKSSQNSSLEWFF